jgi:cell division protein FtsZ
MADDVLYDATRGISDLITGEGLINLDFADVETTMKNGGTALLGMSTEYSVAHQGAGPVGRSADGKLKIGSRAEKAAIEAISSPLFDGRTILGAKKVLVNVTGGPSLGIREAMAATEVIQAEAGDDCEVIFGAMVDEAMEGRFQVTVIATGLVEKDATNRPVRISSSQLENVRKERDPSSGDGAPGPAFLNDAME